jgi:peptidoglycan lytic transglycosylase G
VRRILRLVVVLMLLALASAGAAAWIGLRSLDQPLATTSALRYKVAAGASFARVAADLGALGVVAQPRAWVLYARWKGLASAIKAGEYEIEPGLTPRSLLAKMVKGDVVMHTFTIVDGWRVRDMLAALRRNPDVVATLPANSEGVTDEADLMQKLGSAGSNAEGQFLPETYKFPGGTTDVELLLEAHTALSRELAAAWNDRAVELPLQSPEQLLTLASIVEKESSLPEELPKIAGLYLHRLRIGMRLQADPTVIYGLGPDYDGTIHTVDLRTDGPYNTYTRTGLPPTPIALPSAAAIRASAHPEPSEAIYFVASGNGDGSHVFSATLEQQNAAVAHYLANQRRRQAAGTPQ